MASVAETVTAAPQLQIWMAFALFIYGAPGLSLSPKSANELTLHRKGRATQEDTPAFIAQYGPERTASTLQFELICGATFLRTAGTNANVDCKFVDGWKSSFTVWPIEKDHMVVKSHHEERVMGLLQTHPKSWVYQTYDAKSDPYDYGGNHTRFAQSTAMLADAKPGNMEKFIRSYYGSNIGLDDAGIQELGSYLDLWVVLRECCGTQMSQHWRDYLTSGGTDETDHPVVQMCLSNDLDKVQSMQLHHTLEHQFRQRGRSPADASAMEQADTYLNCTRGNAIIAKAKTGFNDVLAGHSEPLPESAYDAFDFVAFQGPFDMNVELKSPLGYSAKYLDDWEAEP
jgi:hypothetical protein